MIAATTGLACVLGDPVAHSRSPAMQNAALRDVGLDCVYVAFRVPAAQLEAAVHGLAALGASGANVTLPHKEAAALLCDSLSDEAVAAGAANTLVFRNGQIRGHLTDGLGMLDALRDEGVVPSGRPALVRGRGRIGARCGRDVACSGGGARARARAAGRGREVTRRGARVARPGRGDRRAACEPARDRRELHAGRRADRA